MNKDVANMLYQDGMRPLPWHKMLRAYLIRFVGWLLWPVLILALWAYFPQTALADGPHHLCPAWCQKVITGAASGFRYFNAGNGKVYAWGTPARALGGHVVVIQNGRFVTQFKPASGIAYVINRVYEDARVLGYNHAQATYLARGAITLNGALAMRLAGALAGPAGSGLVILPCIVYEKVIAGFQCQENKY